MDILKIYWKSRRARIYEPSNDMMFWQSMNIRKITLMWITAFYVVIQCKIDSGKKKIMQIDNSLGGKE